MSIGVPSPEEYNSFYETYVSLVDEKDILAALDMQRREFLEMLGTLSEEKAEYRYAEGKWSIKQVMSHILDAEVVFFHRAFKISKGEKQNIPGFDQDEYMTDTDLENISLAALLDQFALHRSLAILYLRTLPLEAFSKMGSASNNPITVRALVYIMVGHCRHHMNILKERYGV